MNARGIMAAAMASTALVVAGCGGSNTNTGSSTAAGGGASGSGGTTGTGGATTASKAATSVDILKIGTINYIDSMNPFNYIEGESQNAFVMVYPQLVQYTHGLKFEGDWATKWETSADGKTWTFHLRPGKWSDGKPMTSDDAAWWINTTIKYKDGPTAVQASALNHATKATAPDPQTLTITYEKPVANVLAQLQVLPIGPRHVYEPLVGSNGKGLKTFHPEQHLPIVGAGAYIMTGYQKKGTSVFKANPDFYGEPKPLQKAVTLNYYTNADAMLADFKRGTVDWVDQVPFKAVNALKQQSGIEVVQVPGAETTNITWNSNPLKPKNRELLDPKVKQALSMTVDRKRVIDIVFDGNATLVESFVGHIAGDWENKHLGPREYNIDKANQQLDALGLKRGSDGIRIVPATTGKNAQPAHRMSYNIMVPTSLDFNGDREFEVVKEGFQKAGVEVKEVSGGDATAAYAIETGDNCDATKKTGYDKFDMALWDWIGYADPDAMLSYVTTGQWCSWSDTGYSNAQYDKWYEDQATLVDKAQRKALVDKMQQSIYDNVLYTQLVNEQAIDAHRKGFTGFDLNLSGYSKRFWTEVGKG